MNLPDLLLLADRARWQRLGDKFRAGRPAIESTDLIWAVVFLGAFAVIALVVFRVSARSNSRQAIYSPRRLFRELCDAHGLERNQRRLLQAIAHAQALNVPATIFLDPARLEDNRLPKPLRGRADVVALRKMLFGGVEGT